MWRKAAVGLTTLLDISFCVLLGGSRCMWCTVRTCTRIQMFSTCTWSRRFFVPSMWPIRSCQSLYFWLRQPRAKLHLRLHQPSGKRHFCCVHVWSALCIPSVPWDEQLVPWRAWPGIPLRLTYSGFDQLTQPALFQITFGPGVLEELSSQFSSSREYSRVV